MVRPRAQLGAYARWISSFLAAVPRTPRIVGRKSSPPATQSVAVFNPAGHHPTSRAAAVVRPLRRRQGNDPRRPCGPRPPLWAGREATAAWAGPNPNRRPAVVPEREAEAGVHTSGPGPRTALDPSNDGRRDRPGGVLQPARVQLGPPTGKPTCLARRGPVSATVSAELTAAPLALRLSRSAQGPRNAPGPRTRLPESPARGSRSTVRLRPRPVRPPSTGPRALSGRPVCPAAPCAAPRFALMLVSLAPSPRLGVNFGIESRPCPPPACRRLPPPPGAGPACPPLAGPNPPREHFLVYLPQLGGRLPCGVHGVSFFSLSPAL